MFENKFDEAIEEVSVANGMNWSDESKIRLFARFMKLNGVNFHAWEKFLEHQVMEENSKFEE